MMHHVEPVVLYIVIKLIDIVKTPRTTVIQNLIVDFLFYKIDITITYLIQYI
jgi:hypothetical protein